MNRRSLEVLAWSTAATVGLLASPAAAGDHPGPNRGTVWVAAPDAGRGHEPHVACEPISLWGDKLAEAEGSYRVVLWPPAGDRPAVLDGSWEYTSPGPSPVATIDPAELARRAEELGAEAHPRQGHHFKLDFSTGGDEGGHRKHKTFWVDCTAEEEASPAAAAPPAPLAPSTEVPPEVPTEITPETSTEHEAAEDPVTLSAALEEPGGEVVMVGSASEAVVLDEEPQPEVLAESLALDETAMPVTGGSWAMLTTVALLLVGLGIFLLDCARRRRDAGRRLLGRMSEM